MEFLTKYLAWICGQAADRSWVFGSEMFPLCERCTGIYVGAAISMAMFCFFRPRPQRWSLIAYTLLILQIIPAGLHWWFNTPVLRAMSGAWFGVGLIGLLYRQAIPDRYRQENAEWKRSVSSFLLATAMTLLMDQNTAFTGTLLALLVATGLCSIAVLVTFNISRLISNTLPICGSHAETSNSSSPSQRA